MSKHTSGPWTISHRKLGWELAGYVPIDGVNHTALAHVVWVMQEDEDAGRHSPECEANARLIAAAPDLLAALQALIMDHGGTLGCQRDDERAVAVRAAIAKATGKVERPEDVMDDAAAELRRLQAEVEGHKTIRAELARLLESTQSALDSERRESELLRDTLISAREWIKQDYDSAYETSQRPDGSLSELDDRALDGYRAMLQQIDAAIDAARSEA